MRILIHYPGKLHKEITLELNKLNFLTILNHLLKNERMFFKYLSEEEFYSRFITYKNGKRFYSFDVECGNNDFILIIAVNKLKNVKDVFDKNINNKTICDICKNKNIVYIDNEILEKDKEKTCLCQDCFKRKMEEKVFENISHMKLRNTSIIDFGVSGERDSTVALYFLLKYREETKMNFKINCVFNSVGLGEYDKNRLLAAKAFYKKMCNSNDLFTVNYLNMNFEEDFEKNKNNIDNFTSKYCSLCTRANGFREYGIYNNKDLFTASGSGTIEDCFANKIMNKEEATANTTVKYNFIKTINFRKMLVLDGISEDMVSIYACLNNINYYIGDCPLAIVSPNYLCRENALNPIKARTNWITSSYGDIDLKYNYCILGRISDERLINLRNKCVKSKNGVLYGINYGNKLKKIIQSIELKEKPDSLEKKFYNLCIKSKEKYLNNNFEKYLNIFCDNYIRNNVIITLNDIIVKEINGIYFLYNKITDFFKLIEITKKEEEIINFIKNNEKVVFNDLKAKNKKELIDNVKAIQNLLSLEILELQLSKNKKTEKIFNNVFVQDKNRILNKSYQIIMQEIFEVNKENIIFDDLMLENCKEDDIIVILENDTLKIKQWYKKLKDVEAQVIYIHISPIITIFTNDYESIEKNWNITIDNSRSDIKILDDNFRRRCRVQILSALSEIVLCDLKNIKNKLKNYNVIYYINLETGQKRKQLY